MSDLPFLSGKDGLFRLFLGGPDIQLKTKTWSIKKNAVKVADGVCGEDRDRLQTITNYFEVSSDVFLNNTLQLDAMLNDIAQNDAGLAPLVASGAMRLRILDGSRASYTCGELVIDDWDIRNGGRTDRLMMGLPMRFRYFKKGKAV